MTHDTILIQAISEHQTLDVASNQQILYGNFIILVYNFNLVGIKNTLPHHCYNCEIQDHLLLQDPECQNGHFCPLMTCMCKNTPRNSFYIFMQKVNLLHV